MGVEGGVRLARVRAASWSGLVVRIVNSQLLLDVDGGGYGHWLEASGVGVEGGHFDADGEGPAFANPVVGPGGGLGAKAGDFEEEAAVG